MNKEIQNRKERYNIVYESILALNSVEECERFLDDLLTVQELEMMAQRLGIAKCLYEGKMYKDIVEMTNASTATISRVNRAFSYGDGGYKTVLDRLTV